MRFAMRYLRAKVGAWKTLAGALGFKVRQVVKVRGGYKAVSPKWRSAWRNSQAYRSMMF